MEPRSGIISSNNFGKFFFGNFYFRQNFFFGKIFFGKVFFWINFYFRIFFLAKHFFWQNIFFGEKIFLAKNFFLVKFFFPAKSFFEMFFWQFFFGKIGSLTAEILRTLNFCWWWGGGYLQVINSCDIADMDKCCLNKCHHNSLNLVKMVPGTYF